MVDPTQRRAKVDGVVHEARHVTEDGSVGVHILCSRKARYYPGIGTKDAAVTCLVCVDVLRMLEEENMSVEQYIEGDLAANYVMRKLGVE